MAPIAAHMWEQGSPQLLDPTNPHGRDFLLEGKAPKAGDIMKMPHLAETFKVSEEFLSCDCVARNFMGQTFDMLLRTSLYP